MTPEEYTRFQKLSPEDQLNIMRSRAEKYPIGTHLKLSVNNMDTQEYVVINKYTVDSLSSPNCIVSLKPTAPLATDQIDGGLLTFPILQLEALVRK